MSESLHPYEKCREDYVDVGPSDAGGHAFTFCDRCPRRVRAIDDPVALARAAHIVRAAMRLGGPDPLGTYRTVPPEEAEAAYQERLARQAEGEGS